MSNESMPEILDIKEHFDETGWVNYQGSPPCGECNYTPYTRTDTIPDVAELQRQNAALKAFATQIITEGFLEHQDLGAWDIKDAAEIDGIITDHPATEDDVEREISGVDNVGDPIFELAPWMLNNTAEMPTPPSSDTALKISVVRWNDEKKYWEALSDGTKNFDRYYEDIESDFIDAHPGWDSEVPEAFIPTPCGEWYAINGDFSRDEEIDYLEKAGYQVFVIPSPPSHSQVAREFRDAFMDSILDQDADFYDRVANLLNDKVQEWEDAESK